MSLNWSHPRKDKTLTGVGYLKPPLESITLAFSYKDRWEQAVGIEYLVGANDHKMIQGYKVGRVALVINRIVNKRHTSQHQLLKAKRALLRTFYVILILISLQQQGGKKKKKTAEITIVKRIDRKPFPYLSICPFLRRTVV